jgi:3-oxoacyl-ACP reductase-like protein
MKFYNFIKFIAAASIAIGLMACTTEQEQQSNKQPSDQQQSDQQPGQQPADQPSPAASAPATPASATDQIDPSIAMAAEHAFQEGLNFYGKGQYADAIKKFKSKDILNGGVKYRVNALKYTAFSYCVMNQLQACEKAFLDALRIDHKFNLQRSEKNHPIWGPVFQKALLDSNKRHRRRNKS